MKLFLLTIFTILIFATQLTAKHHTENYELNLFLKLLDKLENRGSWTYYRDMDRLPLSTQATPVFRGKISNMGDLKDFPHYFRKFIYKNTVIFEYYNNHRKAGSFYYERHLYKKRGKSKLKIAIWYTMNERLSQANIYLRNNLKEVFYYNNYGVLYRKLSYNAQGKLIDIESDFVFEDEILGIPEY